MSNSKKIPPEPPKPPPLKVVSYGFSALDYKLIGVAVLVGHIVASLIWVFINGS
jgi:hypothetical protein